MLHWRWTNETINKSENGGVDDFEIKKVALSAENTSRQPDTHYELNNIETNILEYDAAPDVLASSTRFNIMNPSSSHTRRYHHHIGYQWRSGLGTFLCTLDFILPSNGEPFSILG